MAAFESPGVVPGSFPAFYEHLKDQLTFPLSWEKSRARSFRAWRRAARSKVEEFLIQPVDTTRFDPEIIDDQAADGHRRRSLVFNVTQYSRVHATMLLPNGPGPFPAVLLLHDHGSKFDIGKEKLIRPWYDDTRLESARSWADEMYGGRFVGDELVARGYAVLCVDALGWGDRSGLSADGQQALASNFFNLGSSMAGLVAREDLRAAAFLASLPEVDAKRISAVGFSMGGFRAWQVAALSDHISAAVAVSCMTTVREMMVPSPFTDLGQSAFFMQHPGLNRHLDMPDVASIAAPKPLLFFNGEDDPAFAGAGVTAAYAKMRTVWASQRAAGHLGTKSWPGLGHVFAREMQDEAFAWLDRQGR
ncbi:alpha/beta fold hydrolase [Streptomyces sp. NPDC047061]|uniref:dienelactone hydrolase family protein n=1 Tax=Streptomyces sp. NPDC047061 TaxID=3154605 RepID=UPI00340351D2